MVIIPPRRQQGVHTMAAEKQRLADDKAGRADWRRWGPYVSERQWGTVREDYSPDGNAWSYLPHEHARSRAYRWGEDGIAGFSDDRQHLCLSLALWNGRDPLLKERLFGLTNSEGNHGEDVKELYYYLDATPTHSFLKMLYKYPQGEFPYRRLLHENRQRSAEQAEFELLDTGLFDADAYFDVFVEYAKAATDDILMQVTAHNRGAEAAKPVVAAATVLPQHLVVARGNPETHPFGSGRRRQHRTPGAGQLPPRLRCRRRLRTHTAFLRQRNQRQAPL
jgi:hypothetical protein